MLLTIYAGAFILYLVMIGQKKQWKWWLLTGIAARCILLFFFPNLSDDIYRFFWDGHLTLAGINPFSGVPKEQLESGVLSNEVASVYPLLNSKEYYSVYPFICQVAFAISAWIGGNDIHVFAFVLRLIVLIFEGGTLLLLIRLLSQAHRLLAVNLYALNPLVIIELTGNAHPEGIMIFFILLMFVLLQRGQFRRAALSLAAAIATKLIPILLVPFLWRRLGNKRWSFVLFTIIGCGILFIPVYATSDVDGYFSSIALYFRQFEFNAFTYSIVKSVIVLIQGYHDISITGPIMAFITGIGIMLYSLLEKRPTLETLPLAILVAWTFYLFFSTTVHPWYICPLIALGIITGLFYPIVWSALIFVSYSTYRVTPPEELSGWIAMEYAVVATFFITELWCRRKPIYLKNKSDQRKTLTAFDLFSTYLRKINRSKDRAPS